MDISSFVSIFEGTKVQFFLELQAVLVAFYNIMVYCYLFVNYERLCCKLKDKFYFCPFILSLVKNNRKMFKIKWNKDNFLPIFFLICNVSFGQLSTEMNWEKLYRGEVDSVVVVSSLGYTRETAPDIPGLPEEQIFEKRQKVSLKEGKQLLRALQKKCSFNKEYPLLDDVGDTFYFYKNGVKEMVLIFTFSTKGTSIYRRDELIFAGKATPFLQRKIGKALGYNPKKIERLNN